MRNLLAKELKIKFIKTIAKVDYCSYGEGNPFTFFWEEKKFIIFLKNLSSAYFKKSKDITRIQLPFSNHFKNLSQSDDTFFLALGYDIDNNVFVCWNPKNVTNRLNAKKNVSLYSRESLQNSVIDNELKIAHLSNGEKIVLFKSNVLIEFFRQIDKVFDLNMPIVINEEEHTKGKTLITEIDDKDLLKQIKPLLENNKVLESVEICMKHYRKTYPEMSFSEWFNIVKILYNKINNN